jgi:hypothetical protein
MDGQVQLSIYEGARGAGYRSLTSGASSRLMPCVRLCEARAGAYLARAAAHVMPDLCYVMPSFALICPHLPST